MRSTVYTLFSILILSSLSFSQKKQIDSLNNLITTENQDTTIMNLYIQAGSICKYTQPDSAMFYYNKSLIIADNYFSTSNKSTKKTSYNNKIQELKAETYNNIGVIYLNKSEYKDALNSYLKALKIFETTNNKYGIATCFGNIGGVNYYQGNKDKAINNFIKALKIYKEIGDKDGYAANLGNVGIIYHDMEKYDKALEYYFKTLKIYQSLGNKTGIATNLGNIGLVFQDLNKNKKALEFYKKALKKFEELGHKRSIALNLTNISSLYKSLKQYNTSIIYAKKALKFAKEIQSLDQQKEAYLILSESNKELSNYKEAFEFKNFWIKLNDSIFNKEKIESIEEISAKYESEKQEKIILKQKNELKASKLEKKKEKIKRNLLIIAISLMMLFVLFLFYLFINKRKTNILLKENKDEFETLNEELTQSNEELSTSIDVITNQKDEIEIKNRSINSSIVYASKIQRALLPIKSQINKHLNEYFILYKPKDIVSGDFYWYKKIDDNLIFVVADATGHGVPGAFMSMLGIAFLNEIVKKEIPTVADILNELRDKVKESLHQTGYKDYTQDGFDMSIISLNTKTLHLEYSGAYNSLFIVREGKLIEIKADRMPVGVAVNDSKSFTNKEFKLQTEDIIYMFSDGYQDQINENTGKKFMFRKFKELIIESSKLPIINQESFINDTFESWKGNFQQVDDVLVVGIKV